MRTNFLPDNLPDGRLPLDLDRDLRLLDLDLD